MSLTTITNNQYREVLTGYDLPENCHSDFDYMDDITEGSFFKYKGDYYDINEFMSTPEHLDNWHGISSDTFFSAVVILFNDSGNSVKVGRIYS